MTGKKVLNYCWKALLFALENRSKPFRIPYNYNSHVSIYWLGSWFSAKLQKGFHLHLWPIRECKNGELLYSKCHLSQTDNSSKWTTQLRGISDRITGGNVTMDGENRGAANHEVKKKWAGKPIYSQVKTVRRGRRREKAVKWTQICPDLP